MAQSTTQTVIYFLKLYKRYYVYILALSVLAAVFQSLALAALLPLFNIFFGMPQTAPAGFMFSVVNAMIGVMPFTDKIVSVAVLLILLSILQSASEIFNDFLISYASGTILYDIKDRLIRKYSTSPYQYFLDTKQGELIYNTLMAPKQIAQVLLRIPQIFVELLKILAIAAVLMSLNVRISLIFIGAGIILIMAVGYMSRNYTYKFGKQNIDVTTKQNVVFNEFLNGIKQIYVYGVKERWVEEFNKTSRKIKNLYIKSNTWFFAPNNLVQLVIFTLMVVIILILKVYYAEGFFKYLPVIGIYAASLLRLLPSINNLGRRRMELMNALPDSEKVIEVFSTLPAELPHGKKAFSGLRDSIVFKDVRFSHKARKDILKGVNARFTRNTVTAIVGDSGSGKTTLVNLVLGLFHPTSGCIEVDGADLAEYDLRSWLDKIGFVSQDAFIYHATIKDNITFGSSGYSDEYVIRVAKLANAHEFISEFPNGYDMIVGERGMKLSGGQQQRIAIARAILKKPEIIILDEATSALDNISERSVQGAINAVSKDHTVIIVAHRLSSIQNADKILFLKDGIIVEEGSHAELISRDGFYKNMYAEQSTERQA